MLMDIKRLYIELFPLNIDTYAPNEYQLLSEWSSGGRWWREQEREKETSTHARYVQKRSLPAITIGIGIQCNLLNYTWNFFHSTLYSFLTSLGARARCCCYSCWCSPLFFSLHVSCVRLPVLIFAHFVVRFSDVCTFFFFLQLILCRVEKYTTHHVRSFITFFTWVITATTLNKCILMLLFGAVHVNFRIKYNRFFSHSSFHLSLLWCCKKKPAKIHQNHNIVAGSEFKWRKNGCWITSKTNDLWWPMSKLKSFIGVGSFLMINIVLYYNNIIPWPFLSLKLSILIENFCSLPILLCKLSCFHPNCRKITFG